MKRFLRRLAPILAALALVFLAMPLLAQATGVPVPAPVETNKLGAILASALGIFAMIEGLKNLPFISGVFTKIPSLAVWLNAAGSLISAFIVCNGPGGFDIQCALTAVGTFIGAAGIHNIKTSLSAAPTPGK
jgi:hypothetical protein